MIVLELTPKGAHPYSKRVFYLDGQTYVPLYVLSYDARGICVRLSLIVHGHPDFVLGAQDHASQFVAVKPMFNGPDAPQRFEIMELLRKGK